MKFTIHAERPLDPRLDKEPTTLGEHLLHYRLRSEMEQKQMAKLLGCRIQTYGSWERDDQEPMSYFFPAIVELLGYLPMEDLSTYYGVLRSARLRRGLDMSEMARRTGANPAVWTCWERGIYVPAFDFVEKLQGIGIDLSRFNLHGDIVPTPLAKALRKARKERHLSHLKMGQALGYTSTASWHRFELTGVVPPKDKWEIISDVLGVNIADFAE